MSVTINHLSHTIPVNTYYNFSVIIPFVTASSPTGNLLLKMCHVQGNFQHYPQDFNFQGNEINAGDAKDITLKTQ